MPPQHLNELHVWWVSINRLLFCASKVPSDILAGSYWAALSHASRLLPPRWPTGPSSHVLWMTWTRWRSANRLRDCIPSSSWWLLEPHILPHQSLYFPCMIKYWSLRIIVNSRSEPKLNQKVENKSILGHLVSDNPASPEGGGSCMRAHLYSRSLLINVRIILQFSACIYSCRPARLQPSTGINVLPSRCP